MPRARPQERMDSILTAATRVFAQAGYHRARVRDIAREAGVAEGTLYRYFPSKEDMLLSLFRNGIAHYLDALERELAGIEDAPSALTRLASRHLEHLQAHRDFARVTQIELREAQPGLRDAVNAAIAPYLERIESIVRTGQAEGRFDPDIDPRLARDFIFGTLDACVTTWVMARHPYALGALAPQVARLLLRGLGAAGPPVPAEPHPPSVASSRSTPVEVDRR